MAVILTAGSLSMLKNKEQQAMDLKPVVQVTDIQLVRRQIGGRGENNNDYRIMISDGSYCEGGTLGSNHLHELIRSRKLHKGSIIRLTSFSCSWIFTTMFIRIKDFSVILDKCDIIGDPKPLADHVSIGPQKGHANKQRTKSDPQVPSKKQKRESSNPKKFVVPEEAASKNARMTAEKNKEEDDVVGDCIEKLEKLGWKTQEPLLYDTALLLIGENGGNRKLWLKLLKPESCVKWVRTVGSKYGLLG